MSENAISDFKLRQFTENDYAGFLKLKNLTY